MPFLRKDAKHHKTAEKSAKSIKKIIVLNCVKLLTMFEKFVKMILSKLIKGATEDKTSR